MTLSQGGEGFKAPKRFVRQEPLPLVPRNKDQLYDAFEQVLECCGSMREHGGNLEVKAQQRQVGGHIFAEVKVAGSSAAPIVDSVTSEQHSDRRRIKLGMTLAAEILRRHRDQFTSTGKIQIAVNQGSYPSVADVIALTR